MISKTEIFELIKNPESIKDKPLEDIQILVNSFPYFQPAQVLLSLKLKQLDHLFFDNQIKRTAAQSGDRKRLYEILFQSTIQQRIEKIDTEIEIEIQSELVTPLEKTENSSEIRFSNPIRFNELGKKNEKERLSSNKAKPKEEKQTTHSVNSSIKKNEKLEEEILLQAISTGYSLELNDDLAESDPTQEEIPKQKFGDWLKTLNESKTLTEAEQKKKSVHNLIDNFIQNEPQISKLSAHDDPFSPSGFDKLKIADDDNFITETLAKIYVKQGNIQKAKKAYNKLIILHPDRASVFRKILDDLESNKDK